MNLIQFTGVHQALRSLVICSFIVALAACGNTNSTTSTTNTGLLNLAVTDAPVDEAVEVIVVFESVELKPLGADPIVLALEPVGRIDLLQYRDGETFNLLEQARVQAQEYEWIRLRIRAQENLQDGSFIRLRDGRQYPLFIPSGAETGLKLIRRFTVAQGGVTRLLIDFDLRKSLVRPPGQAPNWILKPALRLTDRLQTGTLTGTVDLVDLATSFGLRRSDCDAGLYLFRGWDQTPDDMDGDPTDGDDPVVYQPLDPLREQSTVEYRIHFLEADRYTLALTCDFGIDSDPSVSENGQQFIVRNVQVTAGS
jgi:hypothetical protein